MSIEQKIDFIQKLDKSIREKSIQYFIDSKLCRLNSVTSVSCAANINYEKNNFFNKKMMNKTFTTIFMNNKLSNQIISYVNDVCFFFLISETSEGEWSNHKKLTLKGCIIVDKCRTSEIKIYVFAA